MPNKPNNEYTSTAQTEQIAELEAARDEATAKIESLESRLAALPPPTRNRLLVSLYRCIVVSLYRCIVVSLNRIESLNSITRYVLVQIMI